VVEDSAAGIASGRAAGFEVLAVRHASEVAGLLRQRLSSGIVY
jgi:beta-phosphoglucomutase-like phosphatase (HAD superfamily)